MWEVRSRMLQSGGALVYRFHHFPDTYLRETSPICHVSAILTGPAGQVPPNGKQRHASHSRGVGRHTEPQEARSHIHPEYAHAQDDQERPGYFPAPPAPTLPHSTDPASPAPANQASRHLGLHAILAARVPCYTCPPALQATSPDVTAARTPPAPPHSRRHPRM